MRIFLYEFVTGGGFFELPDRPLPSGALLTEGEAMWRAIYQDFARVEDVEVVTLRDARLPASELAGITTVQDFVRESFFGLAVNSDFTILIAPEFDGHALEKTRLVESLGLRLLSPNTNFVSVAGNKTATAKSLAAANVQIPNGVELQPGERVPQDFPFPAIAKRNDGAGSMCEVLRAPPPHLFTDVMRFEQMVNGLACSISFLCQAAKAPIACPPMQQILSCDGQLTYLGGKRIMDPILANRANRLGHRAIAALPPTLGYVGVDVVLGNDLDGSEDFVIEVNPRLTTSYIGLRKIATTNLAEAMIQIATDFEPDVKFCDSDTSFLADGTVG